MQYLPKPGCRLESRVNGLFQINVRSLRVSDKLIDGKNGYENCCGLDYSKFKTSP